MIIQSNFLMRMIIFIIIEFIRNYLLLIKVTKFFLLCKTSAILI